jgi:hypothetical protein
VWLDSFFPMTGIIYNVPVGCLLNEKQLQVRKQLWFVCVLGEDLDDATFWRVVSQ